MKNFQIFLTGGRVQYAAADNVEVRQNQVILSVGNRIIATYDRPSVIMMDEFRLSNIAPFSDAISFSDVIRHSAPGACRSAAPVMQHLEPALQQA